MTEEFPKADAQMLEELLERFTEWMKEDQPTAHNSIKALEGALEEVSAYNL